MRRSSFLLGAVFCLILGGCGFQLADSKGVSTKIPQASLQMVGGAPGFRQVLKRKLRGGGVKVVQGDAAADLIVYLEGPKERHQVIAVTTDMDAREYEVGLHLTVRLQRPGEKPSAPAVVSRYRHWLFDSEDYLAADEARAVLKKELSGELIEALLLRIRAYAAQ